MFAWFERYSSFDEVSLLGNGVTERRQVSGGSKTAAGRIYITVSKVSAIQLRTL